jgi:hypothetical protein
MLILVELYLHSPYIFIVWYLIKYWGKFTFASPYTVTRLLFTLL